MMSFLSSVVQELQRANINLSTCTFILPSKRAGSFLRKEISKLVDKPLFSPKIISIEEFSEEISQLQTIDNTTTLFEFYTVYKELTATDEREEFEQFSTWAQTLIHDFNEIDRYLVPPDKIFNYLSDIQDINHWSSALEKTELVKNYLAFWKRLPEYYRQLQKNLLSKNQGYQGLVYRQAADKIEEFAGSNTSPFIFIGFNALNSSEQVMFQKMLEHNARIYWDVDETFFQDAEHDVALFLREYERDWPWYQDHNFEKISSEYTSEKEIEIIGIPKSVGQAKHVGEILSNFTEEELESTALVLGDESLLLPVLNSLPENIPALNITMGYPVKYSPFSPLFEKIFELYKAEENVYYYKNVISILGNPVIQRALDYKGTGAIKKIREENLLYIKPEQLRSLFSSSFPQIIPLLFPEKRHSPAECLENLLDFTRILRERFAREDDLLNLEFLYQYNRVFENLKELLNSYPHISSVLSLHHFYKELSGLQSLDFQGKPFQGLQLMGMLESRVLDFETVILTSVNEGILPAGKSTNSFIPSDLKRSFGLPTYKEKDAVYTYHFYHLLHRAKRVFLLHNTDTESQMGGEKSRFLLQLEVEKQSLHKVSTKLISPQVLAIATELQEVEKTPEILQKIQSLAEKGFSPSALTTYMRNPLDFYRQYILNIRDKDEVEETVAYNTLGTVVHDTLETFYAPLVNRELTIANLKEFQNRITSEVKLQFEKSYSKIPLSRGKNLLIFEVARRYVNNFLQMEIKELEAGKKILIKQVEANLVASLDIENLPFPVRIRGKVDRVDMANGVLRIIDYKTGKVEQPQLEIIDWDLLTSDYDQYSKPFQVLMYAAMLLENNPTTGKVEAGVISFKNLKQGFLKFGTKSGPRDKNKNCQIDPAVLANFKVQLKNLVNEICDPEIPFIAKEIKSAYGTY